MASRLTGVFCAATTPLQADLSPDAAKMVEHCKRLLDDGCHGIALLGSTGEANHFSLAERKAILEAVVASGIAPEKLLPGVGVCALPETVELTRHALSLGVETVVMLPPFYYKTISEQGLIDAFTYAIATVNDPRLKVILYHIPPISMIPISFPVIRALIERFPGQIVGVKDSGGDIENMKAMIDAFPELSILTGADPFLLPLMGRGGAGCITATSNLVAAELRTVFDGHDDPARAKEVAAAQDRIVKFREISNRLPQIPTIKAMVGRRTGDAAWRNVRPPFVALTAEQAAMLDGWLNEAEAELSAKQAA